MHGQSHSSPAHTRARLAALGRGARKRLSQSFLDDERVAAAIVRAAHLQSSDEVLEVGPGLGILTQRLVRAAARVVAVEIDADLVAWLGTELHSERLSVVHADIMAFDIAAAFERPFAVVANLPYHISSPVLRRLLRAGPPFARRLVIMLQVEVAQRIAAQAGQMSALAVGVQAQARVSIARSVPRAAFYPRPNVDSAVVVLEPIAEAARRVAREDIPAFEDFVHAGFKQPRKQLANSLADGLRLSKADAIQRLELVGIDPTRRPQELSVDDWARLFHSHT